MFRYLAVATMSLTGACHLADEAIDSQLDFSGLYEASDGTQIQIPATGPWVVQTLGSYNFCRDGFCPIETGDTYAQYMEEKSDSPGSFRGYLVTRQGLLDWGNATFVGESMSLERTVLVNGEWVAEPTAQIAGQSEWTRKAGGGGGSGSGGGGGSGGCGGASRTQLLHMTGLEGEEGTSTFFTVSVPAGKTNLLVELYEDEFGSNLGDLFVSRTTRPSVSSQYPYQYTADCASINPNREKESCSFNSPSSGQWQILLYGYHAYYGTSLCVTTAP